VGNEHKLIGTYTIQNFWVVTLHHWAAYDASTRRDAFLFKDQGIVLLRLLAPWRWQHYVPSKCREPHAQRHSITPQNTWILTTQQWEPQTVVQ